MHQPSSKLKFKRSNNLDNNDLQSNSTVYLKYNYKNEGRFEVFKSVDKIIWKLVNSITLGQRNFFMTLSSKKLKN